MDIQQVALTSPVRVLEKMMAGGLGSGRLGVCMARAGVGKTAFLVQIGLDAAIGRKNVLHIALGQITEHVQSWYETLLDDLLVRCSVRDVAPLLESIANHRVIQSFADRSLTPARLEHILELYLENLRFTPDVIIIDGYDWESQSDVQTAAMLGACKSCAWRLSAELWMGARTHRSAPEECPKAMPEPCLKFDELIDVGIFLAPTEQEVRVCMLKAHGTDTASAPTLMLHCDTFALVSTSVAQQVPTAPAAHVLLSGGAFGAEEAFGQCAEAWGVQEINYTFEGHKPVRTCGLVVLSDAELEQGHVSQVYLNAQMHRSYPDTPVIKRVIQSIWHQVNTAAEVFVVGTINDNLTVRGGTGWAAELGRHWRKRVYVFDQDKNGWFRWSNGAWVAEEAPKITAIRFTGTGTRNLTDEGREAIQNLFKRSFGEPGKE